MNQPRSMTVDDALTAAVAEEIADLGIGGAQVAVATDEGIRHGEAGIANRDLATPVTGDTVFQIGSTTKVFTAVLVMQLVDRGLVDIDEPVARYLPGMRLASDDASERVTPRQLMSMTSGLDTGPYLGTGRGDDCIERYVEAMAEIPMISEPGAAYGYTNASTVVSGLLVERIGGVQFDAALRDRVLAPLGLTEAVSLFEELPYHRVAVGAPLGSATAFRGWHFSRGMGPAGSTLAMSARHLAEFGRMFLPGSGGPRVLDPASIATMQTPQVQVPSPLFADAWCVGPYSKVWGDVRVFGHGGTTENGSSMLIWLPEFGISIATLVNTSTRGYLFADRMLRRVLGDLPGLRIPARPDPEAADIPIDPAPYLGRYRSWNDEYLVQHDDGGFSVTVTTIPRPDSRHREIPKEVSTPLVSLGGGRFLPVRDEFTNHHRWDVSFTLGADGTAELLHNGAFAARRVGA